MGRARASASGSRRPAASSCGAQPGIDSTTGLRIRTQPCGIAHGATSRGSSIRTPCGTSRDRAYLTSALLGSTEVGALRTATASLHGETPTTGTTLYHMIGNPTRRDPPPRWIPPSGAPTSPRVPPPRSSTARERRGGTSGADRADSTSRGLRCFSTAVVPGNSGGGPRRRPAHQAPSSRRYASTPCPSTSTARRIPASEQTAARRTSSRPLPGSA